MTPGVTEVLSYRCNGCQHAYETRAEAERCAARGLERLTLAVGDVVTCGAGFGWFDGDVAWVSNPAAAKKAAHGNCFGDCCTYAFYYVVTAIVRDPDDGHRERYYVETRAMSAGTRYRGGYTYVRGHKTPKLVSRVPAIHTTDAALALRGRRIERLL